MLELVFDVSDGEIDGLLVVAGVPEEDPDVLLLNEDVQVGVLEDGPDVSLPLDVEVHVDVTDDVPDVLMMVEVDIPVDLLDV